LVDIRPFRAIRYTEKAGDPADLITKPYDKISSMLQREYYKKSLYNYCRLILPVENNKYETAKRRIEKWLDQGIMAKDREPAIFVYRQEFKLSGRVYTRTGLIASMRLCSYEEGMVFPHEVTYKEPKTDRLKMLRAVQKDLEPVFLIYSDPDNVTVDFFNKATRVKPLMEIADSFGVKHSLWRIIDSEELNFVQKAMVDKRLVITDGHHRYESALVYRDEMRSMKSWTPDAAFNFHMCYIVPVQEEGLVVLPTHRLLTESELTEENFEFLEKLFTIRQIVPTVEALDCFLKIHEKEQVVCLYDGSKAYGLLLKDYSKASKLINADCPKEACLLDVVILRDIVFKHALHAGYLRMNEHILYAESTKHALEAVDNGQAKLAFLVNPVNPETVWQIAQKNWRLPEKSTDFYPKPVSGLTMMDISAEKTYST
jgi:uncharacterized protein (DUF1015 family)